MESENENIKTYWAYLKNLSDGDLIKELDKLKVDKSPEAQDKFKLATTCLLQRIQKGLKLLLQRDFKI
jgi:hypothetical protein